MIHVILPAYDEEAAIRPTLLRAARALSGVPWQAVLVDDGSRDRTVAEARRAAGEAGFRLTVLAHDRNRGLGAALRTGFEWCLECAQDDDVLVTLDADATHSPEQIPALAAAIGGGHDVAIASRYRPGARVRGVPAHRRLFSLCARLLLQACFPIAGVRDYTCGFRACRAGKLRAARRLFGDRFLDACGFEAVTDLLLKLRWVRIRAVEIPIELDYRERVGRSKMSIVRTLPAVLGVLARRFGDRAPRYEPPRVRTRAAPAETRR